MTQKIVWFGIAVMTTLLSLAAAWQFRSILLIVLLSLALAASVRPLAKRWPRRGLGVRLAVAFLLLLILGFSAVLLILGGVAVIREIRLLANSVAGQNEWKLPLWLQGSALQLSLAQRLPSPSELFAVWTGDQGQLVLPAILGVSRGVAGLVSGLVVVLFLSIYWSLNQTHFEHLWLSLLPPGQRNRTRTIWQTIEMDLGAYIRSQVLQSLLAGLLLGFGYWALGSPYPTLLALAGALAYLIPMVGVGLAVIIPLMIGLLTSVQLSLFMALYSLFVLIAMEMWVKPRLFNHRQYNPILTVILLIALWNAFGLIGVIAAPPLSAAIQILGSQLFSYRAASGSGSLITDLKERQARLTEQIQAMDDPPVPLVTSSMERLNRLIERAEPVLQEQLLAAREPLGLPLSISSQSKTEESNGRNRAT